MSGARRVALCWLGLGAGLVGACRGSGGEGSRTAAPERLAVPAPSLAGSVLSNPATEPALVFLPPGYHAARRRYPVVYYLPGYTTDVTEYIDGTFGGFHLGRTLHRLVASGRIRPLVVVVVNGRNPLGGSFYVNSPVTGRWEDHVVRDVVGFVERRYRLQGTPAGRGIAGDSMGGFGALHLAMRHPDLFGAVFALSPVLFDERGLRDEGMLSRPYAQAWRLSQARMATWPAGQGAERLAAFADELFRAAGAFAYRRALAYAYGAAFAPNPRAGPPFIDYPIAWVDGRAVADPAGVARWEAGLGRLAERVARHLGALRRLRGIGLDVGRRDRLGWVLRGTRRFAQLLAANRVRHRLSEHDGGHNDHLGERIETVMLPFFSRVLAPGGAAEGPR